MLDHLALQCADSGRAADFYLRVFAPCGIRGNGRRGVAAARAEGAEILHEAAEHPEYHPGSYGVFFRDPDGNNVEAVHHGSPS